ncbi:MAG: biotin--[acetyl-CoA-carboxylase] ligase [Myxococcales bacterium]|nr:biotin--[acetyl-CoA-carboxylase] ligase [Myxococcales bacterium]
MIEPQDSEALAALARRGVTSTRWAGKSLVFVRETGSTNDDVREAARRGAEHGYTVVADAQTSGRGRRGRVWHSPVGANLTFSLLTRPRIAVEESPMLALAVGLAVARALDRFVDARAVSVKWPNDVRIHKKKCAGVLVEGVVREGLLDAAVVGIGLNVFARPWPEALAHSATCIEEHARESLSRAEVLVAVLEACERTIDAMLLGGSARRALVRELASRCDTLGTRVDIDGVSGVALRIDDDGGLVVRGDDGVERVVRSGEIR